MRQQETHVFQMLKQASSYTSMWFTSYMHLGCASYVGGRGLSDETTMFFLPVCFQQVETLKSNGPVAYGVDNKCVKVWVWVYLFTYLHV